MAKLLIPMGSLTGDPIGTKRYTEFDEDNRCTTAANQVTIDIRGRRFDTGTPHDYLRGVDIFDN